jgi:hypothetical protein
MLASVSSYFRHLGVHSSFVVSHSTAHNRGRAVNFTDTTFAKRELAVKTLRKVKSVKTTPSTTRVSQIHS